MDGIYIDAFGISKVLTTFVHLGLR